MPRKSAAHKSPVRDIRSGLSPRQLRAFEKEASWLVARKAADDSGEFYIESWSENIYIEKAEGDVVEVSRFFGKYMDWHRGWKHKYRLKVTLEEVEPT